MRRSLECKTQQCSKNKMRNIEIFWHISLEVGAFLLSHAAGTCWHFFCSFCACFFRIQMVSLWIESVLLFWCELNIGTVHIYASRCRCKVIKSWSGVNGEEVQENFSVKVLIACLHWRHSVWVLRCFNQFSCRFFRCFCCWWCFFCWLSLSRFVLFCFVSMQSSAHWSQSMLFARHSERQNEWYGERRSTIKVNTLAA